jgi:hypothetical protein
MLYPPNIGLLVVFVGGHIVCGVQKVDGALLLALIYHTKNWQK